MKTIILILSLAMFNQPNFNAVITAIEQGNVSALSSHLDENVEITIGDSDGSYPKSQATQVVDQFFNSNKPSDCNVVHSGSARDNGSYYCIGSLTAGGKKHRVYLFFKQSGNDYKIQEMRFEED